jgi:hypothetical protein
MSYDLWVQGFENGGAAELPSAAFHEVLGPHMEQMDPDHGFWRIRAPDGGEADIYSKVSGPVFDGLMISRFSSGNVIDLLADLVHRAQGVILSPEGMTLLSCEPQREHLPEELREKAVTFRTGSEIVALLGLS